MAQAQAVKFRLLQGLSVRRAAYSVVKFIMDKGAKGCEVVVSGKLRGQRAKAMKFRDGYMIHAGDATNYYVEKAVKHVHLRQGVIGIKVKIMLPHDPTGENGISRDLPDAIKVHDPDKDDSFDLANQYQPAIQPSYMSGAPATDVRKLDDNLAQTQVQAPPQQQEDDQQQQQDDNNNNNNPDMGGGGGTGYDQPPQQDVNNNQGGFGGGGFGGDQY